MSVSRRNFLQVSLMSGLAAGMSELVPSPALGVTEIQKKSPTRVSLTAGADHIDNIFQGLKRLEKEIQQAIGNRKVVIKPNNVSTVNQLSATHVDCLKGILEFLKSIGKSDIIIAESAANGPTIDGYRNYGYLELEKKYPVKLVDLDQEKHEIVPMMDERDIHPYPVRMSSILLDRSNYLISAAVMKTHDRAVATLSLKNMVFGAPIKDEGFSWGNDRKPGAQSDKPIAHGGGYRGINYNLFAMAPRLHPDLAVIDGYQGMEGNGPVGNDAVDHKVAVVSTDWLAADRTAVELMGIDFAKVGYLNYCAKAGYGEADLQQIEMLGPPVTDHIKPYRLHPSIERQLVWQKAKSEGPW